MVYLETVHCYGLSRDSSLLQFISRLSLHVTVYPETELPVTVYPKTEFAVAVYLETEFAVAVFFRKLS